MEKFLVSIEAHGWVFGLEVLAESREAAENGGHLLMGAVRPTRLTASVPSDDDTGKGIAKADGSKPGIVEIPLIPAPVPAFMPDTADTQV